MVNKLIAHMYKKMPIALFGEEMCLEEDVA